MNRGWFYGVNMTQKTKEKWQGYPIGTGPACRAWFEWWWYEGCNYCIPYHQFEMRGGSQLSSPCPSILVPCKLPSLNQSCPPPPTPPAKLNKTPIRVNSKAFCPWRIGYTPSFKDDLAAFALCIFNPLWINACWLWNRWNQAGMLAKTTIEKTALLSTKVAARLPAIGNLNW